MQDAVKNQHLLSDHYLSDLLPQEARWQEELPFATAFLMWLQERYAADYGTLTARLAATDRLIDQVVYQLYGLTDDEIAIVEAA